jgi:hypothetical protein
MAERTAEVDLHSAHMAIFIALSGMRRLPDGDLYELDDLPRSDVKAWVTQDIRHRQAGNALG